MLCENRREGFGPHSTISSPIPTSCFVDVILVPLPIWIAIALLPLLLLLPTRRAGRRPVTKEPCSPPLVSKSRRWLNRAISGLYYVLIICNVLMQTLEIVRLSLLHYGIGLLPFAYVGLIMGAALHWTRGAHGRVNVWQAVNLVIWLGSIVMAVVKVAGLAKEGIDARKGSEYPMSDQVIDVGVMAGVYAVIAALEVVMAARRGKRTSGG